MNAECIHNENDYPKSDKTSLSSIHDYSFLLKEGTKFRAKISHQQSVYYLIRLKINEWGYYIIPIIGL